jgi:hypothetical protein
VLATHPSGDFVFALAFLEMDDRELQVARQESDQSGFGLQARDVAVEVKTVQTLDGESDVLVENRFNRGQGFGRSFHGLVTRELTLPAHEIETALWA